MFGIRRKSILLITLSLISLGFNDCSSKNHKDQADQSNGARSTNSVTTNTSDPSVPTDRDPTATQPDEGGLPSDRQVRQWTCNDLANTGAIFGVTITNIDQSGKAVDKLKQLADASTKPVVTRIIFDPILETDRKKFQDRLEQYKNYANEIHKVSCVMGEIGDSHDLYKYLPQAGHRGPTPPPARLTYEEWTAQLTTALDPFVDIWEFGNELNGGWTGWKCREDGTHCEYEGKSHAAKISKQEEVLRATKASYETILRLKSQHRIRQDALTAITLYYNQDYHDHDCGEYPEANLKAWLEVAKRILPSDLKKDVDFVLLSFYEKDCGQVDPTAQGFYHAFASLRDTFDGDKTAFGLGESGYKGGKCTDNDKGRINNSDCQSGNAQYITEHYTKLDQCVRNAFAHGDQANLKTVRYIGGYFYWWYLEDLILSDNGGETAAREAMTKAARTYGGTDCH